MGLGLFFAVFETDSSPSKATNYGEVYPGFAVVELFTSITCFGEKRPDRQIDFQLTDSFTQQSSNLRIFGNARLLRAVMTNILDNASKYSSGQPIGLRVDLDQNWIVISFADRGMGIPEAQLEDVFLPIMRASNVGNTPGFDLGLQSLKRSLTFIRGN
ncbi:MAG: hypothetical protein BGO21_22115 [Dyadobacter sp. 50-39]|nr:MAG: hypothetical protein BGO21_22115 [Dyadobacter sp. 50-39]